MREISHIYGLSAHFVIRLPIFVTSGLRVRLPPAQKKRYPKGTFFLKLSSNDQPRQEPGRYFGATVVPSPEAPQRQPNSVWLAPVTNADGVVAFDSGSSVTTDVFTTVAMPCTVAFTTPLGSVWSWFTYFVCCDAVRISQPQPSDPGAV